MRSAVAGPSRFAALAKQPHGKRVHGVAGVHGDRHPDAAMHGGIAAPQIAAVLDIVVHQKGVVQHFKAGGRRERVFGAASQRAGGGDAQRRPQALAGAIDEILDEPVEMPLRLPCRYACRQRVGQHLAIPAEAIQEPGRSDDLAAARNRVGDSSGGYCGVGTYAEPRLTVGSSRRQSVALTTAPLLASIASKTGPTNGATCSSSGRT